MWRREQKSPFVEKFSHVSLLDRNETFRESRNEGQREETRDNICQPSDRCVCSLSRVTFLQTVLNSLEIPTLFFGYNEKWCIACNARSTKIVQVQLPKIGDLVEILADLSLLKINCNPMRVWLINWTQQKRVYLRSWVSSNFNFNAIIEASNKWVIVHKFPLAGFSIQCAYRLS